MKQKATIICSTNQFEKVYALFNLANGYASFRMDVTIFFTFHGLELLRKDPGEEGNGEEGGRPLFLKKGYFGADMSKMIEGMEMKKITSLEEQFNDVRELGVEFIACDMSMDMMGLTKSDLINDVKIAGIGTYVSESKDSDVNLFI